MVLKVTLVAVAGASFPNNLIFSSLMQLHESKQAVRVAHSQALIWKTEGCQSGKVLRDCATGDASLSGAVFGRKSKCITKLR